jgi:hypothetical protein
MPVNISYTFEPFAKVAYSFKIKVSEKNPAGMYLILGELNFDHNAVIVSFFSLTKKIY